MPAAPLLLLAALLTSAHAAAPCRYGVPSLDLEDADQSPSLSPLAPKDCAFVESLEEPLRRIAAAGSLPPQAARVDPEIVPLPILNAFYSRKGMTLTYGFISCLSNDRDAALQILCHEMGHAVQRYGADARARQVMDDIESKKFDRYAAENAPVMRAIEGQADLIGRELCTRAGLSMEFTAQEAPIRRCAAEFLSTQGSDHPMLDERMAKARADRNRLLDERARDVGAAIQRRARRLMAGLETSGDAAVDLSLTPRQWAITPAGDQDRLGRAPYRPSRPLSSFEEEGNFSSR